LPEAAVEVRDVTKTFGSTVAARGISLRVERGEFFSFLGPSGCGKTTVLRMIAGFEKPSAGQIFIAGNDIVKIPPHKRPVNMVFQSYALFPHLSVLDNVAFGLRCSGVAKADVLSQAKNALALVRLQHLADRLPSQLSGGQQQRVALARAVVKQPLVLLLDEPLSALDPHIREEMQTELARLQQELNMTFIMVTHDQDEALALSHRVAVFSGGNLEQIGSPAEIYAGPRTRFVAHFMGNSNLITAKYVGFSQGRHQVTAGDGKTFDVANSFENDWKPGDACLICVKPEDLELSLYCDSADPSGSRLRGRIAHSSYKGSATEFLVQMEGEPIRAELLQRKELELFRPGVEVFATFDPEDASILRDTLAEANSFKPSGQPNSINVQPVAQT
jgi:spermidine/putrescine transport system ATP-binding protein